MFPFVYFTKSARKKRRLQCSRELIAAETKALCVPMSQPFMNSVKAINIQSEMKQKSLIVCLTIHSFNGSSKREFKMTKALTFYDKAITNLFYIIILLLENSANANE